MEGFYVFQAIQAVGKVSMVGKMLELGHRWIIAHGLYVWIGLTHGLDHGASGASIIQDGFGSMLLDQIVDRLRDREVIPKSIGSMETS